LLVVCEMCAGIPAYSRCILSVNQVSVSLNEVCVCVHDMEEKKEVNMCVC